MTALFFAVSAGIALAEPGWGAATAPDSCLGCHKDDPTASPATDMYMAVHDSSVGECLSCHVGEDNAIHGPWMETPESCARCHRTHSAVADDLLTMGKDELCLFCHGTEAGLAQTNVIDGVLRLDLKPLRGGGFEQTLMNTSTNAGDFLHGEWMFPVSSTAQDTTSKHTLGVEATIWGAWNAAGNGNETANAGDTNTVLQCVSCHDPHAYGVTYRMLTRRPEGAGVAKHPAEGGDPWTQRVFVTDQLTFAANNPLSDILSYTTDDYSNTEIGNKTWTGSEWEVEKIHLSSYAAPGVLDGNGTPLEVLSRGAMVPMYSQQLSEWCASCHDRYHAQKVGFGAPGSTDNGDLIFGFQHKTGDDTPVWDEVDGRYETSSCGYGCHNSALLNCVECHVAHGTSAQMGASVTAMPWPGEGAIGDDTYGTLVEDVRAEFTGATDFDGETRSNLLRIDNRGVCQNPNCHPKGTVGYLNATDDH